MKSVLFVCTGNTCRSPMAEGLFTNMLKENGISDINCKSGGIYAHEGDSATDNAILAMKDAGIDISSHKAHTINSDDVTKADVIYCMTPSHKAVLIQFMPEMADKIHVLGDEGIMDPFGGDLSIYISSRNSIANALKNEIGKFKQKND